MFIDQLAQPLTAHFLTANHEAAIHPPDRQPFIGLCTKQERGRVRYFDLRLVTSSFNLRAACEQRFEYAIALLDCSSIHRTGDMVKLGIRRIEDDESKFGENLSEELGERASQRFIRRVGRL